MLNPNIQVAWWNNESTAEHYAEIVLNTLPFVAMLLEYPFNQIPLDWRMLPFNLLVTVFYGVANFFVSFFTLQKSSIYDQLDWFGTPVRAIENFGIILLIQIIVFTLQWFLTEKYKLPKYRAL